MGKESNKMSLKYEMQPTNSNRTESKNHSDIYNKNHCNISDQVDIQELLLANSKSLIDNCDIS